LRTADQQVVVFLDDLELLVAELRRIYPTAVASADAVRTGSQSTGVSVRSSGISDPTGDAAVDPRRRRRQASVKKARSDVKAAVVAARSALSHAIRAADR
jgi:hypothetical protein